MTRALAVAAAIASALAVPLIGPTTAGAAAAPYSVVQHEPFGNEAATADCRDTRSTVGVEFCDFTKIVAVDKRIDGVALAIRRRVDAPAVARIDAAQKAWVAYRLADCRSAGDLYEGGTAAVLVAASCELDDSALRLTELNGQLAGLARR